jgi:hypothetical protein
VATSALVIEVLSEPLAAAGVSILPIAIHDTDYLLVREQQLVRAIAALRIAGHAVNRSGH